MCLLDDNAKHYAVLVVGRDSIFNSMQKSVFDAENYNEVADLDKTLDKLIEFEGKIDYQLVQQKIDSASGNLLTPKISTFDQG